MQKGVLTIQELQKVVEQNLVRDMYLTPVLFLCTENGTHLIDATDFMQSDNKKDVFVQIMSLVAKEKNAYKMFFVFESWIYEVTASYTKKEIQAMAESGAYRDASVKSEAYQILEITEKEVNAVGKKFTRAGTVITLGDELPTQRTELLQFKLLQECLQSVN